MIIRSKAPLRLGFAGGGTDVSPFCDYYTGYVLNASIDLYAYCTIEETNDNCIEIISSDKDEHIKTDSNEFLELTGRCLLHKGIYNRIVSDFTNKQLSFKMLTYSDAPVGSGLGSSSTMVVAILKCFIEWLNIPLGEYEIARLAYEIERVDLNLAGGRQDQYAAAFGGFNFMEFYADNRVLVNPLRVKNWIRDEFENSLILFYTGISRDSENIILEQREKSKANDVQCIDAMKQLKADALHMKEALLTGNFKSFATILGSSWEAKKRTAHSVSNTYIDELYTSVIDAGALSGKISGAGGGGFFLFFVDPFKRVDVLQKLSEYDGKVVNFHFSHDGSRGWKI